MKCLSWLDYEVSIGEYYWESERNGLLSGLVSFVFLVFVLYSLLSNQEGFWIAHSDYIFMLRV